MSGRNTDRNRGGTAGPSISAIPFREASNGKVLALLTERERSHLARIASLVRFRKAAPIYRERNHTDFLYNIAGGVAKTFRTLPDGTKRIAAFLFPGDLMGLAEEGVYVNSADAVTPLVAYRLPLAAFESLLRREPTLESHLLCKLCHALREAQRHAFVLGRYGALAKVAMFIQMLDRFQAAREESTNEIYLPMTRSDIADYTAMSLAAVSRSFRTLTSRGLVRFRDRQHLQIADRGRLEDVVLEDTASGAGRETE